ncbi:hypothetical protein ACIA5C_13695 [Actinoplanes sp. NPDC051343]|jgi:hypothetical protein|uniref:hypothetical protein n=1 Tax=Actinoplanes sp. NPDC051343 TaxID=3363906 RepID=UPI0037AE4F4E
MTDATSDADPAAADPADAADPAAVEAESEEVQPFENRAARRSKGKTAANHTGNTTGRVPGRSGTVQSPRQYGNRRSG